MIRILSIRSPGEWEHLIQDAEGRPCGKFRAAIRHNEEELRHSFNFKPLGGFQKYAAHITTPRIWPMAVLDRIDINKEKQRMGFGRRGLAEFYAQAVSRGAVIAFGKLGWDDDDWGERNRRFYSNAGWLFLPHDGHQNQNQFMYRALP